MRRSFYLPIGILVLCVLGLVFEKPNQVESTSRAVPKPFGHYVRFDMNLSDPSLRIHTHLPFSNSEKDCEIKNSPSSIDLDY